MELGRRQTVTGCGGLSCKMHGGGTAARALGQTSSALLKPLRSGSEDCVYKTFAHKADVMISESKAKWELKACIIVDLGRGFHSQSGFQAATEVQWGEDVTIVITYIFGITVQSICVLNYQVRDRSNFWRKVEVFVKRPSISPVALASKRQAIVHKHS